MSSICWMVGDIYWVYDVGFKRRGQVEDITSQGKYIVKWDDGIRTEEDNISPASDCLKWKEEQCQHQ